MKGFTIYTANCIGNAKKCIYPTKVDVQDIASLERAMRRDHVCAMCRDHKRSAAGFEWSDCIHMDCDNNHSEDPAQWKQPEDVVAAFPNVTFAVCYSRNHMKEKKGKSARPRFHCYFPVERMTDSKAYTAMKRQIQKQFPWFDANALDAARFYFGTEQPDVMFFEGNKTIDQVLPTAITVGSRNATLSQKAGKLIKRYGDTAKAKQLFKIEAERCVPPLSDDELASIWRSAKKFGERIADRDDYIPSEQFNTPAEKLEAMRPESSRRYAWSDIDASRLFADYYKDIVRYVPERQSWYCYADVGNLKAMEYCKELADAMLMYALSIQDEQKRQEFLKYCGKWQTRRVRDTILRDAQGIYPIAMSEFDCDPYVFNCKNGTLHLDTIEFTEHRAEDRLTKISDVEYDPKARCDRLLIFIDEITSGNTDMAKFLQKALSYGISGDTRHECLFILYGTKTRNGKGTLCESILKVLGSYGCTARPETISIKQNVSSQTPSEDIARLAGVRFTNISEPGRGPVLNAAQVKSMTGNDTLNARFLHENSFDFKTQFKLYINTNYLPVINDMTLFSSGRVAIIPFDRHFEESEQDWTLKSEFAKPQNQSAILNWLVEGYRLAMQEGLTQLAAVIAATTEYKQDSDKVMQFADEKLEAAPMAETRTSVVYEAHRGWCSENGCYAENMRNFNQSLRSIATVTRKRPSTSGGATTLLCGYRISGAAQPL